MKNTKKKENIKSYKDGKYLEWVHKLTHLGYDEKVMISSAHSNMIDYFYLQRYTPEQALEEYKKYLNETKEINN